ncbi:Tfiih basal transcription factor complex p44 subunit [Daphnia magna]|uniref:Tfiih basal transcription factor complex p44 subunit n=1 Tax=Daphnia magna TaxID=35525 RepID=A0A164FKC9_9CRUS|nr:Tfiih basal transcription factor complex p44 subunit [Daphnia magna]
MMVQAKMSFCQVRFAFEWMDYFRYRAVKHPTLHVLHKCENLICVQVGLLRLQRLMEKPTSSC